MRLYNSYLALESTPNELRTKLVDIRTNLDELRVQPVRRQANDDLQNIPSESKTNMLNLMEKLKKGIEILDKMHTKNAKDVTLMQQYINNHRPVQ